MAYSVTKCDVGGSTANGYHYEYLCESADDIANLPTGASSTEISRPAPGSLAFIESDSTARYILKISREWSEYPMSSGGGGGTEAFVVTYTMDQQTMTVTCDKTFNEIMDGAATGAPVVVLVVSGDITAQAQISTPMDDDAWLYAYFVSFSQADSARFMYIQHSYTEEFTVGQLVLTASE